MSLQCIFKTLCCCSLKTNERKQRISQKVCLDKSSVIIIYFSVVFQLNDCVKVQIYPVIVLKNVQTTYTENSH